MELIFTLSGCKIIYLFIFIINGILLIGWLLHTNDDEHNNLKELQKTYAQKLSDSVKSRRELLHVRPDALDQSNMSSN